MTAPSLLDELEGVVKFLLGERPLDGRWFGDDPPVTASGMKRHYWWRTDLRKAHADMAKRLEAAERDAFKWQLLCADCDDAGEGNRAAINVVNDACRLGSGALERHYGQAARDGLDAAIDFKWLINHLRKLEPEREAGES